MTMQRRHFEVIAESLADSLGADCDTQDHRRVCERMTRTFILYIPVRLAVEADSIGEARAILLALASYCAAVLPTGARLEFTEDSLKRYVDSNTVG